MLFPVLTAKTAPSPVQLCRYTRGTMAIAATHSLCALQPQAARGETHTFPSRCSQVKVLSLLTPALHFFYS